MIEVELEAEVLLADLVDDGPTFLERGEQVARIVAQIERLDDHLDTLARRHPRRRPEVRYESLAVGALVDEPGHHMDLRTGERLGVV